MRRLALCALSLALAPALSLAGTNNAGESHCQEFATQQLKEIKQDYYGALTRDETDLVLQVAERSCLAMYGTLEEERETIRSEAAANVDKTQWWEKREAEGLAIPNIKKAQRTGGK